MPERKVKTAKGNEVVAMITNTIVPYCFDIGHVLGLPKGFSHRFRYWERWIKLDQNIRDIRGKDGVVVLRHFDTGRLVPIRKVRFEDVISLGDIHYIEFEVREFVVDREATEVSEKVAQAIKDKGFDNIGGAELECLVLEVGDIAKTQGESSEEKAHEGWTSILREVGRFECYRDFGFLRIIDLRDANAGSAAVVRDETGKYSYRLRPGDLYFLDVVQHIPWSLEETEAIVEPYEAELEAETGEIVILRGLQRVVGKYDLLRFIFKTASGESRRQTFIEVESKQGGEAGKYGLRRLFLPVQIELPRWKKWLRNGRLFIGILAIAAAIGSEFIARYLKPWVALEAMTVQALALVVLVLVSGKFDEVVKELVQETKTIRIK